KQAAMGPDNPNALNFSWLIRLRWGSIGGQVATIVAVHQGLGIPLPLGPLGALIAIQVALNALCVVIARGTRTIPEWMLVATLAADIVLLTALLYLTGGPFNPFSFLYLVHV